MTNERAIELLHRISDSQFDSEYGDERREALDMAVRALSGGGDTISRKMAIDTFLAKLTERERKSLRHIWTTVEVKYYIVKILEQLPSAQPERKTGKWITVNGRIGNEVECDKCHSVFWYWMGNYRFCPSCGADMRGESDED